MASEFESPDRLGDYGEACNIIGEKIGPFQRWPEHGFPKEKEPGIWSERELLKWKKELLIAVKGDLQQRKKEKKNPDDEWTEEVQ